MKFRYSSSYAVECKKVGSGHLGCRRGHCLTVSRVHASGVHIYKSGSHLIRFVKLVWVIAGTKFLYNASLANGQEVTAVPVAKGVFVHLALQSTSAIVCTPTQHCSIHSFCAPVQAVEQHNRNNALEVTLIRNLLKDISNDGLVEITKGKVKLVRHLIKRNWRKEKGNEWIREKG